MSGDGGGDGVGRGGAFRGTARWYLRFRERYPAAMLEDVVERAGVGGDGVLLDVGCGPGPVALPLSRWFRRVVAADVEPDMVEVGRQEAAQQGIGNVEWLVSRAEDLDFPDGHFELVTVGNAFHRVDREVVGRKVMRWLAPGRYLAVIGGGPEHSRPWRQVVRDCIERWRGQQVERIDGPRVAVQSSATHDEVLGSLGFEVEQFEHPVHHEWTLDALVGRMWSTSLTSHAVLGDRAEAFEQDLRRSLLAHDPSGRYPEDIRFFAILARVPSR